MKLFDAHCHYNDEKFDFDRDRFSIVTSFYFNEIWNGLQ